MSVCSRSFDIRQPNHSSPRTALRISLGGVVFPYFLRIIALFPKNLRADGCSHGNVDSWKFMLLNLWPPFYMQPHIQCHIHIQATHRLEANAL